MHQPWASLLVAGIKKHEGRSWYTSHRGRLWIAATAKPVDPNEVKMMESFYRAHLNGRYKKIYVIILFLIISFLLTDDSIEFPKQYPTAVLLGCVLVQVSIANTKFILIHLTFN